MSTVISAPTGPCHWSSWEAVRHRFREPCIVGGWVCSAMYSECIIKLFSLDQLPMSHLSHTKNEVKNGLFSLICLKDVFVAFSWPIRIEMACISSVLVHKKFKNHLYAKSNRISEL